MDSAAYLKLINSCNYKIEEKEEEIAKLKREISEGEEAAEGARRLKSDFDDFVERKKQKNKIQNKGWLVKSFSSFISQANDLLCGNEYTRANDRVLEINERIINDLEKLREDLNCCNYELEQLKKERNGLYAEYQECLNSEKKGE